MSGRRGITFIEIMAAVALFSAVVATALVSMKAARESLEQTALERRAREMLEMWRISQATEDPLPEEFTDDEDWVWRIIDEGKEPEIEVSDEQIEAARNAPDMETALRLLGVDPAGPDDPAALEEVEEVDLSAPLVQISWSTIRVEVLPPHSDKLEPFVVLRWRYIEDMEPDQTIAMALSSGSSRVDTVRDMPGLDGARRPDGGVFPPGSQIDRRMRTPIEARHAVQQLGDRPAQRQDGARPSRRRASPVVPRTNREESDER